MPLTNGSLPQPFMSTNSLATLSTNVIQCGGSRSSWTTKRPKINRSIVTSRHELFSHFSQGAIGKTSFDTVHKYNLYN